MAEEEDGPRRERRPLGEPLEECFMEESESDIKSFLPHAFLVLYAIREPRGLQRTRGLEPCVNPRVGRSRTFSAGVYKGALKVVLGHGG